MITTNSYSLNLNPVYGDIISIVKQGHNHLQSTRGWDYNAVVTHGAFAPNKIALDIGGAMSYLFLYVANLAKYSFCIDPLRFEGGREWFASLIEYNEILSGKAIFLNYDAANLPFPDNFFDTIYTVSAMEHFVGDDDISCVKEVARCLKPSGLFLGTVDYNPESEYPINDWIRCYTYQSFIDRILIPSKMELVGEDTIAGKPISKAAGMAEPLFFKLRKP